MFRSFLLASVLVLGACASCSKSKKEEPGGITGKEDSAVAAPLPSFPRPRRPTTPRPSP